MERPVLANVNLNLRSRGYSSYFIKYAFMDGWKSIFPTDLLNPVFTQLEKNLNALAKKKNEFKVTIPIAYIEAEKP